MSTRKLSFYDHHRQDYHDAIWKPEHGGHVGQFEVGDYCRDGGVGPRGELALMLYDLRRYADRCLNVQIRCFDDAHGSLRALDKGGVLRAIERSELRTRDDLASLLMAHGLRDTSDKPIAP